MPVVISILAYYVFVLLKESCRISLRQSQPHTGSDFAHTGSDFDFGVNPAPGNESHRDNHDPDRFCRVLAMFNDKNHFAIPCRFSVKDPGYFFVVFPGHCFVL
jgi:hypothetical protein